MSLRHKPDDTPLWKIEATIDLIREMNPSLFDDEPKRGKDGALIVRKGQAKRE